MKLIQTILMWIGTIALIMLGVGAYTNWTSDKTCDDFSTYEQAQTFYNSDPIKYARLNANPKVNALACEFLPK